MAYGIRERVKDLTTTTGTGNITLAGTPPTGYRAFSPTYATNDLLPYCIAGGAEWEVGLGRLTAATTLARVAPVDGSSGVRTLVNFAAGAKDVFVTPLGCDISDFGLFGYGLGTDGDVSVTTDIGPLTRDMHYRNLTISGAGKIDTAGHRIFVSEVLDVSNAPAAAIVNTTAKVNGTAATTSVGAVGSTPASGYTYGVGSGLSGGSGGSASGSNGGSAAGQTVQIGGRGGPGGNGGSGSGGAGGTGGLVLAPGLTTTPVIPNRAQGILRGAIPIISSSAGGGGAGGGGDGTAGGGGGASGSGAYSTHICARVVKRDTATTGTFCIDLTAGNGGNGASASAGNRGGGGGGGAGGAPYLEIITFILAGTTKTNFARVVGGTGGNGGNGFGTGLGGTGGQGGRGGSIMVFEMATGLAGGDNDTGTAAAAPVTATTISGTAGTAGVSSAINL